jgi:thiol-disulfide isomerase/thioredoxin
MIKKFPLLNVAAVALCLAAFAGPVISQPGNPIQSAAPIVTQVDDKSILPILKPKDKPLLVNFWATWCIPCVEEFPLLVQINEEYKDNIDLITISLDDPAEIRRDVPAFLLEQKATMPAYLLYTNDENAVIGGISKAWSGGLPFTILFSAKGEILYTKQGRIKLESVKPAIESALLIKECGPGDAQLRIDN